MAILHKTNSAPLGSHLQIRNSSTKVKTMTSENKTGGKSPKKSVFVVPTLTESMIQSSSCVTGIVIGAIHVAWVKMSIKDNSVLEWNGKFLPDDFRNEMDESSILKLAYDVNQIVPPSDIYVMETFSMKGRHIAKRINEIHLSSMLAVLLNGVDVGLGLTEKVFFQKKFVLNILYNLIVGAERISTRQIVKNIVSNTLTEDSSSPRVDRDIYSLIQVPTKILDNYWECDSAKQEVLSLAFLLTLSFIDINIHKNVNSLEKVQAKIQRRKYLH